MPVRQESMHIMNAVRNNLESCILGKSFEIQLLLTALLRLWSCSDRGCTGNRKDPAYSRTFQINVRRVSPDTM